MTRVFRHISALSGDPGMKERISAPRFSKLLDRQDFSNFGTKFYNVEVKKAHVWDNFCVLLAKVKLNCLKLI